MQNKAVICGTGCYLPESVMTNADMEKIVDTSDEWIRTRTGIRERHIVDNGQTASDLALEASKKALEQAGVTPDQLTHILVPTLTPDTYCPSAASYLAAKLDVRGPMILDTNAACSGFVYTLQLARALLLLEPDSTILIAASEVLSTRLNWEDRTTCVLFGDGSGAAVVKGESSGAKGGVVEDLIVSSDGHLADLLLIAGGASSQPLKLGDTVGPDYFLRMAGSDVFKHAVRALEDISQEVLKRNNLTADDIDVFLPHQANSRIIEAVSKRLGIPMDRVFMNIGHVGNTSASSVPIALAEAREAGIVTKGTRVLMSTFGAGFTWASALVQF